MIIYQKQFHFAKLVIQTERPTFPFVEVRQTHSSIVRPYKQLTENILEGDGITFTKEDGDGLPATSLPLIIKTADCQPVIVEGKKGIALIHAGWRGVQNKILISPPVLEIEPHYYFFGPSIRACCYEVGEEFKDYFLHQSWEKKAPYFFDMKQASIHQIQSFFQGKQPIKFEDSQLCTFCNKEFKSFRRDKNQERNYNILYPRLENL